jgi:hypothetical protein
MAVQEPALSARPSSFGPVTPATAGTAALRAVRPPQGVPRFCGKVAAATGVPSASFAGHAVTHAGNMPTQQRCGHATLATNMGCAPHYGLGGILLSRVDRNVRRFGWIRMSASTPGVIGRWTIRRVMW